MPLQYSEADLANLIKGLESEFTKELNKAEALAKSEDGEKKDKKPSDEKKDKDSAPPADAKPAEGEPPAAAKPDGADAPPAAPAADAAPAAAPAAPGADAAAPAAGHGYDAEDMQHMQQMYASMSQEELMAHHDAVREALDAKMGAQAAPAPAAPGAPAPGAGAMGKSEKSHKSEVSDENPELNSKAKAGGKDMNGDAKNGGIEGQAPSNPKGARSEASKDSKNLHDAMSKTERQDRNGGKIDATGGPKGSPGAKSPASTDQGNLDDMEKSENLAKAEIEAKDAQIAELKKSLDTAQEFLTKLVSKIAAPKGKAITELASLAKNEDGGSTDAGSLSKSEITQKLLVKSADPKTSPQDRAAINAFYLNGANVNTISHLLK
jgi:hypothetical protein